MTRTRGSAIALCILALLAFPTQAAQPRSTVKLSFTPVNAAPSLHEPVLVRFVVENGVPEAVTIDLGHDRLGNFDFTITRPDGSTVRAPRLSPEGLGRLGKITLPPGQSYSQRLVLNQWFDFAQPGTYRIEPALATAVTREAGGPVPVETAGAISLRIQPANSQALEKVGQELAATATSSNAAAAIEASVALSYMRDPAAVPHLTAALNGGIRQVQRNVAVGLARIATKPAIEALIARLKSGDPETADFLRTLLQTARKETADRDLQAAIDAAL